MLRSAWRRSNHQVGRVALLFALLLLAQAHTCLAVNGIIWRGLGLSWDNPATQLLEEIAVEAVPHTDDAREVKASAHVAGRSACHLALATPPDTPRWLLAFAHGTRGPPAV
jgi:hypothetical protein